ncbi:MAG: tRNA pseudouridine(55) synthase TruB [Parachlamydiales bacterium]
MKTGEGLLLVDKPRGATSFTLVRLLRRLTNIRTIGHAGTLDPFATGVMVMLIGRPYTRLSNQFLEQDKDYEAVIELGKTTDTYDCDGQVLTTSDKVPSPTEVEAALCRFQGTVLQTPPMYSAKKQGGKKLYELARKGIEVERPPRPVSLHTTLLDYTYPLIRLHVKCSKGTYVRSIAFDLGEQLGCGGYLRELVRLRSGPFRLEECLNGARLEEAGFDLSPYLRKEG